MGLQGSCFSCRMVPFLTGLRDSVVWRGSLPACPRPLRRCPLPGQLGVRHGHPCLWPGWAAPLVFPWNRSLDK